MSDTTIEGRMDAATETAKIETAGDGHEVMATLRNARYEDRDLRREALAHAVDLSEAAFRGIGEECAVTGADVVADARLFYNFLKGE